MLQLKCFASGLMGVWCKVLGLMGFKFELGNKQMPLHALGNPGKTCSFYLSPGLRFCVVCFMLVQPCNHPSTVQNTLKRFKYTKMTQNTKSLAPYRNFLNESSKMNKSNKHLVCKVLLTLGEWHHCLTSI